MLWNLFTFFTFFTLYHVAIARQTVVLITGCSTGIGYSAALEFAKHPQFTVWATMRDTSKSTLPDLPNLKVLALDVTSETSVAAAVAHVLAVDGHVDLLINNAGYGLAGALETFTIQQAQALFDVNVWGVVRMLQAVLPSMRAQRSGYIINLSSTSGIRGIPCFEAYTGSKYALEGITDSMRYSLAAFNISVTNVNAGPVKTSFTERFGNVLADGKGTRQLTDDSAAYLKMYTDGMIAGLQYRMDSPEAQTSQEIGQLLVNLATLKANSKRITDIPFNIGSNLDSQKILEEVRVHPTGWGGIYSEIISRVPPLPKNAEKAGRSEL